jgi:leucyl aminopeptidase
MTQVLVQKAPAGAVPLHCFRQADFATFQEKLPPHQAAWVRATGFSAGAGELCLLPDKKGGLEAVLYGRDPEFGFWGFGSLPGKLPILPSGGRAPRPYRLEGLSRTEARRAALAWALGCYRFTRYRKKNGMMPRLLVPAAKDLVIVKREAAAISLVRDLINTPAEDMGPAELAAAARDLAKRFGAKCTVTTGKELLKANYPAVHIVGRASSRAPRLIDLTWGRRGPKVTLVGKGVCFDSGGLDIKPSSGMLYMKKDMGGAAHVLGLAAMIMEAKLPLRLRVLVPAVENSISSNAFRPLDVIATRKGLSVEVGNTDAEGRLILCDALCEADSEDPDLILDFATLTGAARVALGTELPALFCNDDRLADRFLDKAQTEEDPLWRLPLHRPYRRLLESKVADLNNVSSGGYGGAITAALFLQEFVRDKTPWAHIDLMAWNTGSRPGRPEGGEAMALRAAFAVIADLAAKGSNR